MGWRSVGSLRSKRGGAGDGEAVSGDARTRPDAGMVAAGRWCEPRRSSIAAGERPKARRQSRIPIRRRPSRPDWKRAKKRLSPAYLKRRRQAIAELVEKSAGFDGNSSSKLTDARLAGPKVLIHREWKNWLKPTTEVDVVYCAKAELDCWLFPPRTALIFVRMTAMQRKRCRPL